MHPMNRRDVVAALGVGLVPALALGGIDVSAWSPRTALARTAEPGPPSTAVVNIHAHTAPVTSFSVNAYLIETENGLVAWDTLLLIPDFEALAARIAELGKPLLGVLITHDHPDHYAGIGALLRLADVPVVATRAVSQAIRAGDDARARIVTAFVGDLYPAQRPPPNTELDDGGSVTLDGVTFTAHEIGPGESSSDTYWTSPSLLGVAFIGDIVYGHMHAALIDGHTAAWLANLERVGQELGETAILYPGHGGAVTPGMLAWQSAYLRTYRAAVAEFADGRSTLDDARKGRLRERMAAFLPNDRLALLVDLGAGAVAKELAES